MLKESAVTFLVGIYTFGITIITSILVSRALGPEGKGVYTLVVNAVSILLTALNFGLGAANTYYGGNRKHPHGVLFWNSVAATLGISCVAFLIVLGIVSGLIPLGETLRGVDALALWLGLSSLPLLTMRLYLVGLLVGMQHIVTVSVLQAAARTLTLGLLVIFLIPHPTPHIALALFAAGVGIELLADLIFYIRVTLKSKEKLSPRFSGTAFRDGLSYGIQGHLGNFAQFLNYRLDSFLVNYFVTTSAVGVYSVAAALGETLWKVSGTLSAVLFPKVSALGDSSESVRLASKSSRMGLFLTILMGIGIAAVAPWAVRIVYGDQFAGASTALQILLPGIVALSVAKVLSAYVAGRGMPQYNTLVAFLSLAITVGLDLKLIPIWGINGAALASTASYICSTILTIYIYHRLSGEMLTDVLVPDHDDWKTIRWALGRLLQLVPSLH